MMRFRTSVFTTVSLLATAAAFAQSGTTLSGQTNAGRIPIPAVPFLSFTPDSRSGALGDAGVALTSTNASSLYWNPSALVFSKDNSGVSTSFTPWLRALGLDDMNLYYLAGYTKIGKNQVLGLSVNYFDLGKIEFTNDRGSATGTFMSKEFAVAGSYSRQLFNNFALGLNLRYINSNLAGNQVINSIAVKPGTTVAGDISAFYKGDTERKTSFNFGGMIQNLGGKINYGGTNRYFIPTTLKLGTAMTTRLAEDHRLTFTIDVNKLLIPTPPQYDPNNPGVILKGKDPAKTSTLSGIFGSLTDAPDGLSEEIKEFTQSVGVEYWYRDILALRAGYFNESQLKGNRKYLTAGLGVHYSNYSFDFAYLFPQTQSSPLAQTLRLTLSLGFDKKARVEEPDDDDETNQ